MRKCPSQRPRARARTHRSSDVEAVLPTRQLVEDERLASAVQAGDGDHRDGPAHVGELGAHGIVDAEPAPRRVPPAPAPVRVSDGGACVRARSYAAHLDFLSETGPSRPMKSAGASTPTRAPLAVDADADAAAGAAAADAAFLSFFPMAVTTPCGYLSAFLPFFRSSTQLSRSQLSSALSFTAQLSFLSLSLSLQTDDAARLHDARGMPACETRLQQASVGGEEQRGPQRSRGMDAAGGHGSSATAGNRPAPRSRASVSIIDTHVHDTSIRARRVHARSGLADGSLALTSTHAAAGDAFRGSYTLARNTFLAPGGGERGDRRTQV